MLSLGMNINNNSFGHLFKPMMIKNGIGPTQMFIFDYYEEAWLVGLQPLPFYNIFRHNSYFNTKGYILKLWIDCKFLFNIHYWKWTSIFSKDNKSSQSNWLILTNPSCKEGRTMKEGNSKKIHLGWMLQVYPMNIYVSYIILPICTAKNRLIT